MSGGRSKGKGTRRRKPVRPTPPAAGRGRVPPPVQQEAAPDPNTPIYNEMIERYGEPHHGEQVV